jgi:hypothetical protein
VRLEAAQHRSDVHHKARADTMSGFLMPFRIDRKGDSESGINQSKHSRRIVPITRWQIAFAFAFAAAT